MIIRELIAVTLLFSPASFASEPVKKLALIEYACSSLMPAACSWITRDDGTGTSVPISDNGEYQRLLQTTMVTKVARSMNESTVFRRLSLEATRGRLSSRCRDTGLPLSETCFDEVTEAIARTLVTWAVTGERPQAETNIAGLFTWMLSPTARNLKEEAEKEFLALTNGRFRRQQIAEIYGMVKETIIGRLREINMDPAKKAAAISRIQSVTFNNDGCSGSLGALVSPNALYYAQTNSIHVCAGMYAVSNSDYAISMYLAHELSHAIGPNAMIGAPSNGTRQTFDQSFMMSRTLACLRDPQGGNARISRNANGSYRSGNRVITRRQYSDNIAFADQANELFADFMSIEVTSRVMARREPRATSNQRRQGYANILRLFCNNTEDPIHGGTATRARIIEANPFVRRQMGCPLNKPGLRYCSPDAPRSGTGRNAGGSQ